MPLNSRGTAQGCWYLWIKEEEEGGGHRRNWPLQFRAVRNPSARTGTSSPSLPETICKSFLWHYPARSENTVFLPVGWRSQIHSKGPYLKTTTGGPGACWHLHLQNTVMRLWYSRWSSTGSCTPDRLAASRRDQTLLSSPLTWARNAKPKASADQNLSWRFLSLVRWLVFWTPHNHPLSS